MNATQYEIKLAEFKSGEITTKEWSEFCHKFFCEIVLPENAELFRRMKAHDQV